MHGIKTYIDLVKIWNDPVKFLRKNSVNGRHGYFIKIRTYDEDVNIDGVLRPFPEGSIMRAWRSNFKTNLESIEHTGDYKTITADDDFQYYHYIVAVFSPEFMVIRPKTLLDEYVNNF